MALETRKLFVKVLRRVIESASALYQRAYDGFARLLTYDVQRPTSVTYLTHYKSLVKKLEL